MLAQAREGSPPASQPTRVASGETLAFQRRNGVAVGEAPCHRHHGPVGFDDEGPGEIPKLLSCSAGWNAEQLGVVQDLGARQGVKLDGQLVPVSSGKKQGRQIGALQWPGGEVEAGEEKTRHMYLLERKEATYENLRDLNFEYKAGKLSEQDYAMQRASLEDEAAAILAELESIEKARAIVRQGTRRAGVRPHGGPA